MTGSNMELIRKNRPTLTHWVLKMLPLTLLVDACKIGSRFFDCRMTFFSILLTGRENDHSIGSLNTWLVDTIFGRKGGKPFHVKENGSLCSHLWRLSVSPFRATRSCIHWLCKHFSFAFESRFHCKARNEGFLCQTRQWVKKASDTPSFHSLPSVNVPSCMCMSTWIQCYVKGSRGRGLQYRSARSVHTIHPNVFPSDIHEIKI